MSIEIEIEIEDRQAQAAKLEALFRSRPLQDIEAAELRLVTPHYQQRISCNLRKTMRIVASRRQRARHVGMASASLSIAMIEETLCPLCRGKMTSRENRSTGQRFWGCNNYPTCKGTRNTDGEARSPGNRFEESYEDRHTLPSDRRRDNDRRRWSN